jgi:SpoVK/Ycf46/Vps4 family AAA+-type ATPase
MIDHKIYRKMHEHARAFTFDRPSRTHAFDRMPAYLSVAQEASDMFFLLMAPDIHGFYLNEKKWIKLFVDCVQPVSWNKKAYERLVLPPQTKDLVRALVTVRSSQRGVKQGLGVAGKRTDITSGKGNGLIMLLHGGPGTGKTLTAESVAEIAEMPLYRVTCGDIGTSATAVEQYLNTVLHLGKTWNCVLLLDEADVFLEERSMADLKRNSLVSVFLRILEYYDGILILTSNRVGIFDEAFKSRIQVALHYENLNRSSRKKIWQNFLDMLEEDEEDVNFDEIKFHLDDLAEKGLNGRQIRNVLTTARQLAIFRKERLDWEHLEKALAVSSDFNQYLKNMQGHTDDQRARDVGLR